MLVKEEEGPREDSWNSKKLGDRQPMISELLFI